jgi:hypothetical protein
VSLQGLLRTLGRPPPGTEDEPKSNQRRAAAKELTVFSFLKSLDNAFGSGLRKAAGRLTKPRPSVEQLEDRVLLNGGPFPPPPQGINPLSSPHIDLLNDHFLLNFAGHDAELTVTSEDLSPGQKTSQIGGVFIDPSTGVTAAWGGQLSLTNTTKNGYPVENLVLEGSGSGLLVFFTGTVWGAGTGGNFFGNDQLSGTGSEGLPPHYAIRGAVSGNDYDPITAKYQSLGGANGVLGKWKSMEMTTPYGGGIYQKFQNGAIYWSVNTGVHYLEGPIWTEYQATANERGYYGKVVQQILGQPTSDETNVPGVSGARMNTFQGGTIYWSQPTSAAAVYDAIGAKYKSIGGAAVCGLPLGDEQDYRSANDGGSFTADYRVQSFQNFPIYWSAWTGHTIYGAIAVEWANSANLTDINGHIVQTDLGQPTSDEMDVPGVSGARESNFQGGTIYWSPNTGAHAVLSGGIGDEYNSQGGPTGWLGLPTSDAQEGNANSPGWWYQYFWNGKIISTAKGDVYALHATSELDFDSHLMSFGGGNPINAWTKLNLYDDGTYEFSGNFHNYGNWLSYNVEMLITVVSPAGNMWAFDKTGQASANNPWTGGQTDVNWDDHGNLVDVQIEPKNRAHDPFADLWGCSVQATAMLNGGRDNGATVYGLVGLIQAAIGA